MEDTDGEEDDGYLYGYANKGARTESEEEKSEWGQLAILGSDMAAYSEDTDGEEDDEYLYGYANKEASTESEEEKSE